MRLIAKLLGAFIIESLIIAGISLGALVAGASLAGQIDGIAGVQMPRSVAMLTIKQALSEVQSGENVLLIKGATADMKKNAYSGFDASKQKMDDAMKTYLSSSLKGKEADLWKQVLLVMTSWWSDHEAFVRIAHAYDATPSDGLYAQMFDQAVSKTGASIAEVQYLLEQDNQLQLEGSKAAMGHASSTTSLLRLIALLCMTAGPLLSLLLGTVLALSITRPLARGVAFAESVASGDLATKLDIKRRDEVGDLAKALNGMVLKLRETVATVQDSALKVASSSGEITTSAQKLSEGAQIQASTLEETSASVEELTASVDQVAQNAQSQVTAVKEGAASMSQVQTAIAEVSKNLSEIATLAGRSVENALEGAKTVSEVMEGINLIAGSSEKIGGIVTVISDIADQTNLLALNASIEAARAGEHGRGFAVVASEVSKLADRSSSSTKEIAGLIKESVRNVARGVEKARGSQVVMEQIRAASQKVQEMIAGLSQSMSQQVDAVGGLAKALESVTEMSQNISAATGEQTTNARQVSKAVENVNEVTQSAAASAEQMSAATSQLSGMAQELQTLVAQFRIDGAADGEPAAPPAAPVALPSQPGAADT
jgi:methyl-accepting chemotaxis protein